MAREMETVLSWEGKGEDRDEDDGDIERGIKTKPLEEDKIKALHHSLDEVTDKMKDSMEKILQRDRKLAELKNLSEKLENSAGSFKITSRHVHETHKKKNVKMIAAIVIVVIMIAIAIIIVIVLYTTGIIPPP